MRLLPTLAPDDTVARRAQRLVRRRYWNKVNKACDWNCYYVVYIYRDQTSLGTACDGYDKLKPYGLRSMAALMGMRTTLTSIIFIWQNDAIMIHRYSRSVLWLTVGTSNNNPHIIGHHYTQSVRYLNGLWPLYYFTISIIVPTKCNYLFL